MWRLLSLCSLLLGLFLGAAHSPATAAGAEAGPPFDAVVAVRQADLASLLASGLVGEHSFVTAAEFGLDDVALGRLREVSEAAVVPRALAGRDRAPQQVVVPVPRVPPVFVPVPTVRLPVPVFVFRPVRVVVHPVLPPPVFPVAGVLVLPPPPPLLPPPPPPAPCCSRPAVRFPTVPIVPEADTLTLVAGGLALLGLLGARRLSRRRG